MDLKIRPDALQKLPDNFDIIIDGKVRGCVNHAGKWTSQGVVVVLPEFPESLRGLLALLCYENLIGK